MQLAHYLHFFMKSGKAAKMKITVVDERLPKLRELYKAEARASEAEQEFQRQKERANIVMDDANRSMKLDEAKKWHASMH